MSRRDPRLIIARDARAPVQPAGSRVEWAPDEGVEYEYLRPKRTGGTPWGLLVLAGAAVICIVVAVSLYRWGRDQLDPPGPPGAEVVLALGDGATVANIADTLQEEGVIANATLFRWYVRRQGGTEFQAGEDTFYENLAAWEVIETLEGGPSFVAQAETLRVTVPEGLTIEQIASRIDSERGLPYDGAEFLRIATSGELLGSLRPAGAIPADVPVLEGLLFPDTYFVLSDSTAEDLVQQMIRRFDEILEELDYEAGAAALGLTPYQAVIVASLIEEEARLDEDRAKISRVIHNRLEAGWNLGIDATVIYFTGDRVITQSDLETDSPYNTRLRPGLPPTPIAVPGRASLEAALAPEEGDWMYYVLTDPAGAHSFSVTEAEFNRDKQVCEDLGLCG